MGAVACALCRAGWIGYTALASRTCSKIPPGVAPRDMLRRGERGEAMPTASGVAQVFGRAEAELREEIAKLEAAVARAQERRDAAVSRLEELLRVRALVAGRAAPAIKTGRPKSQPQKPASGVAPTAKVTKAKPSADARAVLDAIRAGTGRARAIAEKTGFGMSKIGGILASLARWGLVKRVGEAEYALRSAVAKAKK